MKSSRVKLIEKNSCLECIEQARSLVCTHMRTDTEGANTQTITQPGRLLCQQLTAPPPPATRPPTSPVTFCCCLLLRCRPDHRCSAATSALRVAQALLLPVHPIVHLPLFLPFAIVALFWRLLLRSIAVIVTIENFAQKYTAQYTLNCSPA